ncbi:MAG: protease complex subunit PrcB family protein [Acidobacteria bacterium]|nr:protease complex subunit PrcB family protein [Acidobacteriota bacterium]MBI3655016.1 protease complex subunit PrcB family protein [Acidobacteriota bacterium]
MSQVPSEKMLARSIGVAIVVLNLLLLGSALMYGSELPFQTLNKGNDAEMIVETDMLILINSSEELDEFYMQLGAGVSAPDINMDENTVLAVVAAPRPNTGYNVEITNLVENDELTVDAFIAETVPGDDCITMNVETTPYHLVMTPRKIDSDMNRIVWSPAVSVCK